MNYRRVNRTALVLRAGRDFAEALGSKFRQAGSIEMASRALHFCMDWYNEMYYDYDEMDSEQYHTLECALVRWFNAYIKKRVNYYGQY